ncbi:MAG: hypothetical protein KME67_10830 [Candidatus Thiodiazotropha sp. (ex Codakia orbicularis)]|nr:hypothetical protein [Candidatus Thiodiazotropha sp. (ex Codakia orbicularis)]
MTVYDDIARGFNPLKGLEDSARINLEGAHLKHQMDAAERKEGIAAEDRQNKLNQQAFENNLDVQKLLGSMDEKQREQFQQSMEDIVKIGDFVESQPDPQAAYQRALPYLQQKYPDSSFPKQYDAESMAMLRAMVTPIKELFANETYGAPVEGLDSEGKPAFFQANKEGDIKPVKGYTPLAEALGMGKSELTVTQQVNNEMIDAARRSLKARNLDPSKIKENLQEYGSTGRINSDYDPQLSRLIKLALKRKAGEDPEFEELFARYYGGQEAVSTSIKKQENREKLHEDEKGNVVSRYHDIPGAPVMMEKPPLPGARMAPDGLWYIEDPDRPGDFLQVIEE